MKATATQSEVRTIPAGEFKAKCLRLMDEVAETQQAITVTKHGKAVGQFVPMPAEKKPFRSVWGRSPQTRVVGDIMAPLWTEDELNEMGNISPDE